MSRSSAAGVSDYVLAAADERNELYKAIERVLPPEIRGGAVERRKAVEAEEKERLKAERWERAAVASANFMVAGVHHEGRSRIVSRYVREGDRVFLARDASNKFSRRAVEVRLENGMQIGFVPEHDARSIARYLDKGFAHIAGVTKILTGGRVPIPVVQADIYQPDAPVEGLVSPDSVPAKRSDSAALGGCALLVVLAFIVFLIAFVWGLFN